MNAASGKDFARTLISRCSFRGMSTGCRRWVLIFGAVVTVVTSASCTSAKAEVAQTRHRVSAPSDRSFPAPTSPPSTTTTATGAIGGSTAGSEPLAGMIVGIDPGHNGLNYAYPSVIDSRIWNGREYEACNTTGTETDSGYSEAQFNWNVSQYLEADLEAEGARVVLTRSSNDE